MVAAPEPLLASRRPSPGEAHKLALALGTQVWALALDESANHMDLPSVERIELALEHYPGALVVVIHDDAFARHCTNVTWELRDGEVCVTWDARMSAIDPYEAMSPMRPAHRLRLGADPTTPGRLSRPSDFPSRFPRARSGCEITVFYRRKGVSSGPSSFSRHHLWLRGGDTIDESGSGFCSLGRAQASWCWATSLENVE